jgi:hypothetical protein
MTGTEHHEGHGNTVAAWTAVTVMIVGFCIGAIAFPLGSPTVFWFGVGVVVLGAALGKVLQSMGYGASAPAASESA